MLTKSNNILIPVIILISILLSCKEESVVEQNSQNSAFTQSMLAKNSDIPSIQADSTLQKEKKEKVKKLKREHEKPYVVIEKPEQIFESLSKLRSENKTFSKSPNNNNSFSMQKSQSCYTLYFDVWALEKYHPISGITVGIYPKQNNDWAYNQTVLNTLKNYYAFSKIGLVRMAIAATSIYQGNEILALLDGLYPQTIKESYLDYNGAALWGCFTDEPMHRASVSTCRDSLTSSKNWWQTKMGTSSKFIVGETTKYLAHEFDDIADNVNSTIYTDYQYYLPYNVCNTCYVATEDDQRDVWTDFSSAFGNKFNHLWISGEADRTEMDLLIGHASNLGRNSIWFYGGQTGHPDQYYWTEISEFCYYSFVHGYLRREERKFIYVYNYIGSGDPCTDYQITSWDLVDIIETEETRIL